MVRIMSVLLSDLLRSCSFLRPRRRLSAQPPQSFKIIVEDLYNFDRVTISSAYLLRLSERREASTEALDICGLLAWQELQGVPPASGWCLERMLI